jgi:hypothetical protein
VLQAVQEWHNWKGASSGMPPGEVIKKNLIWPKWQFGRELDLLHWNLGLHVPNSFDALEMFHLKAPVGVQIGRHYPEEKVTVSALAPLIKY